MLLKSDVGVARLHCSYFTLPTGIPSDKGGSKMVLQGWRARGASRVPRQTGVGRTAQLLGLVRTRLYLRPNFTLPLVNHFGLSLLLVI